MYSILEHIESMPTQLSCNVNICISRSERPPLYIQMIVPEQNFLARQSPCSESRMIGSWCEDVSFTKTSACSTAAQSWSEQAHRGC